MKTKKILTIVGARPQFVKAATVSRAFLNYSNIQEIIVHTGQHFDVNMSDIFFEEMDIPKPAYNLNIHGLSHGAMTGQMLEGIEKIINIEKPDFVMVYGDTNSTLAGSLSAKKLHIPVVHVEAGLRSFNMKMPEEINRVLTDRISDILFCPTDAAVKNLETEGFRNFKCQIFKSGDVMEDAALYYAEKAKIKSSIIKKLSLIDKPFVLSTIHRAENTDNIENLKQIVHALNKISETVTVVLPIHPRTKKIIEQNCIKINFIVIDPVGYFDMINLLQFCQLVITDSGGLQKEAYFFRKYCITVREQTEWIELVENGFNFIAGANSKKIINLFNTLINSSYPPVIDFYGNGLAANFICDVLNNQ